VTDVETYDAGGGLRVCNADLSAGFNKISAACSRIFHNARSRKSTRSDLEKEEQLAELWKYFVQKRKRPEKFSRQDLANLLEVRNY